MSKPGLSHEVVLRPGSDIRLDASSNVKHICIIGAGAAGLSALKAIVETAEYEAGLWAPVVYEAREDVGGVW